MRIQELLVILAMDYCDNNSLTIRLGRASKKHSVGKGQSEIFLGAGSFYDRWWDVIVSRGQLYHGN